MSQSFAAQSSIATRAVRSDVRAIQRPQERPAPITAQAVNIVLIGPPGSGKGTQASRVARALAVPTISTGDMLRRAVQAGTGLGEAVKAMMNRGELIGDAMMTDIVAARLREADTRQGFVLDGFPRTVEQAIALESLLERRGELVAVELAVPEAALIDRLSQRRVCERCGVNAELSAGANGAHCSCGGTLTHRSDDSETVVRQRLQVYERATKPLVEFYRQRRTLRAIDGALAPDLVTAHITRALDAVLDRAVR